MTPPRICLARRRLLAGGLAGLVGGAGLGAPARAAEPSLWSLGGLWDDDAHARVTLAHWNGRPALMTLTYGNCRKTCSTTLKLLQSAQVQADRRGLDLDVIVVSLDPTVDTPEAWHQFRTQRALTRPNWRFLSGSPAITRHLADVLGVRYWVYDDHVLHDFRIVAVRPDGHVVARMDWVDQPIAELLDALAAG